jgi:hypothetical protein
MADRAGWNPWRELGRRPHLLFALADLPAATGGAAYGRWADGSAAVIIDPSLGRVERNAALAHELVHDERGALIDTPAAPRTWRPVIAREEAAVNDEVARRLVPLAQLAAFVSRTDALEPGGGAIEVADEFDVPEEVAARALVLLEREWDTCS